MRIFKSIVCVLVCLFCVGILAFSGFFLFRAIPKAHTQPPEVLQTDDIFLEEEVPLTEPIAVPEPEPKPEEPAEQTPAPQISVPKALAEAHLQTMTLEEKIWQLFITTPEKITGVNTATRAGDATKEALEQYPVGGLCYFADNLEDQAQAVEMLSKTQSYAKTKLFLCIDEEGGSVSRAGSNEELDVTHFASAAEYGAAGDVTAVYSMGKTLAEELMALGFNVNFAPVADVATNPNNTEIGDRAYSDDPAVAASMVSAMVEGMQREGMLSCLKHFPGHGSTEADSHEGASVSTRTLEELQQSEWLPFRAGIGQGAVFVMLSHLTNENLSALPADLSAEVVDYLRQELGFNGIIITDSHEMGAITDHYTSGEAAVLALQAGADMILMPADLQDAFDGILSALENGTLTQQRLDESVWKILTVKYAFGILQE